MLATIYHNSNGQIFGVAASRTNDCTPAEIMTPNMPGLRSTEVDLPSEMDSDPGDLQHLYENLNGVVQSFIVEGGSLKRRS